MLATPLFSAGFSPGAAPGLAPGVQTPGGMIQPGTPPNVPPEFDCAMRTLAWEYGKKKLPERGEFRTLFESLQLQVAALESKSTRTIV
jgi:hypothetical protein